MSEATAEEREERLAVLRRRLGKVLRRGESAEYDRLKAEYDRLKAEHVMASHSEVKAAMRARRAEERAQQAREAPKRWKLPRGFGRSPLARERDRLGPAPVAPQIPPGGLSPWRRGGGPMSEVVWRPGGRW